MNILRELVDGVLSFGLAAGVAVAGALALAAAAWLLSLRTHRRDDGFQPVGPAEPPPAHRSPFAPDSPVTGPVDTLDLRFDAECPTP